MSKRRRHTNPDSGSKAATPRGIQYLALKGMSYAPSTRDLNRRKRKAAKQQIRKADW